MKNLHWSKRPENAERAEAWKKRMSKLRKGKPRRRATSLGDVVGPKSRRPRLDRQTKEVLVSLAVEGAIARLPKLRAEVLALELFLSEHGVKHGEP